MTKKYVPLPSNLDDLTNREINNLLGGEPYTVIVRSLLIHEIEAVRRGEFREIRTVRNVWYDHIKPIISRLGILNNKTSNNNDVDWPKIVYYRLKDLVEENLTSYEELNIVDTSRQRQPAQTMTAQLIDVPMVGPHYPWVILFTEKDTIYPIVSELANLYGVSALSGGGQPALSCNEPFTRKIVRSEAYQKTQPDYIIILTLTDYDPAGYSISNTPFEHIQIAANNMPRHELGQLKGYKVIRLGLTPDQLTPEKVAAKAYTPKPKGLAAWVKETGGINGQPLGLELDSLSFTEMRAIFSQEIEKHIDLTKRYNDLREAFVDLMACYQLLPEFRERRAAMISKAKASELWKDIKNVPVPNNLFSEAAKAGAGWISPQDTLNLFSDYQDQLTELWNGD
jgi:hypothetical protein